MARRRRGAEDGAPSERLHDFVRQALDIDKKARRNRKSLVYPEPSLTAPGAVSLRRPAAGCARAARLSVRRQHHPSYTAVARGIVTTTAALALSDQ
jgi:hypothetical protein